MVNYWKSKVLPKIKKVFDRNGKKAAAAEACKSFDDSKVGSYCFFFFFFFLLTTAWVLVQEDITKELEEKKVDLQPKVVEIYEASAVTIKVRLESPLRLKQHKFPGSKPVSEAATKYGPALVSGPVFFIFEKVCTFLPAEEPPAPSEPEPAAAVESASKEITPEAAEEVKKEEAETVKETPSAPPAPAEEAPAPPAPEPAKPDEPAPEPAKA
ncbi:hypothetical protein B296_00002749 [Ensete ventricosum]|uniref:Uncharacterized protein n=1 Tax=Ensete ventricosum TaxID=4639 RepID=A0A427A0Y4_ENSVE|nr:hypothetical protein B296_00002749 [Ensete ventricosum]